MVAVASAAVVADDTPAPRAFAPGELSIGEPIALPFGRDAGEPAATPPGDDPRADLPPDTRGAPVPGSGWLGLAVSESNVPGRWRVEEVAPLGPAARAGIAVGDELRAVNGVTLASAADVSQAMTAIAAGQDVRVAVARADQVTDVVLRAEPRPQTRPAEPSRFVAEPAARPSPALTEPGPPAAPAAGSVFPRPAAAQTAAPGWQAAAPAEPTTAPATRFGAADVAAAPMVAPPAAVAAPAAATPLRGGGRTALGVRTVPIDPATQERFQLAQPTGAYVIGVVQDLPAAKAGVPPGSVIVALGEQPVRSPEELTRLVTNGPLDKPVTVQFVLPGGTARQAAVVLQSLDVPLEQALTGAGPTAGPAAGPPPAPRRAQRPTFDEEAIRTEVRTLRGLLDRLERLLDPSSRRRP